MPKELPKLEYDYNALESYIDEQTMRIHHDKHHQAYIDKLNGAIKGTEWENTSTCEILKQLDKIPESIRMAVRNNGGGHYNHSLFWKMLAPKAGGKPSENLLKAIEKKFGSFEKFQEVFEAAGIGRFGSGWAWLALNKGELEVVSTPNQDNPISDGKKALLGVDVWEHSYYLRYQNKRADYLKAIWHVVNWKYVEERYKEALAKK